MRVMEALTKLVVGMSRLGDYLLRQKVIGIIVATLAFACGAGLAYALKSGPRAARAAAAAAEPADPSRAEVVMRDTPAAGVGDEGAADSEEEEAVFEGCYENRVYGYSVEIPEGMVGLGATPPAPQHGFGIDLDNPRSTEWMRGPEFPKSYVYVDGSYNSLGWRRPDDALNSNLDFLREKGKNVRIRERVEMRLGGLRAVRVIATYEEDGEEVVNDEVVAFDDEADPSIVYTLSLSTPRSKYLRDRPVLKALAEGWCLQPVE